MVNVGDRIGKWTLIDNARIPYGKSSRIAFVCKCDCGTVRTVMKDVFVAGESKSCGCIRNHGKTKSHLYGIWGVMLDRCRNPNNKNFHRYGGRGISVAPEWSDFRVFETWALSAGYQDGLTIDRVNNDGNYEPGNCQWLTRGENSKKDHKKRYLTAFGETKCVADWSKDSRCRVSRRSLVDRINAGMEHEAAITQPPNPGGH